jgi:hypothetical protein
MVRAGSRPTRAERKMPAGADLGDFLDRCIYMGTVAFAGDARPIVLGGCFAAKRRPDAPANLTSFPQGKALIPLSLSVIV